MMDKIIEEHLLGIMETLQIYYKEKEGIKEEATAKGFQKVITDYGLFMSKKFANEILEKLKFRSYEHQDGRPDYVTVEQITELQQELLTIKEGE